MRKSKEERIIEHGDEVLSELHRIYLEGIGIDEYNKLLKEYKKLFRRYEKTIKLSDNMGNEIMGQNDALSDNLQYTIKTARSKLLENVAEHRKTKDAYGQNTQRIKKYEELLHESYMENEKIQKKLNHYIKQFGEIKHEFTQSEERKKTLDDIKIDINALEYKNMDIKKIVSLELSKGSENFVLSKVQLNNLSQMFDVIEENSSFENFIKGTYKYIKNCFQKEDILYHEYLGTFYIITKNKDTNNVLTLIKKLNTKRNVFNFQINFSIGITKYIDGKDTKDILIKRCESAFVQSQETNQIVVK